MDATAAQSPTTFNTTNPHSPPKAAAATTTADLVQLTASNLIKNKRKNFNPRCSATIDDGVTVASEIAEAADLTNKSSIMQSPPPSAVPTKSQPSPQYHSQLPTPSSSSPSIMQSNVDSSLFNINNNQTLKGITTSTTYTNNSNNSRSSPPILPRQSTISQSQNSDLDVVPLHWRQLLSNHRQSVMAMTGVTNPVLDCTSAGTNRNGLEEVALYKIPNTNFSITKSPFAVNPMAAAAAAAAGFVGGPHVDPEAKAEFAFNAFIAVQELLNVYGLSISPGDIVEAFKKQQGVGGILQPPTPPRSPATTTATPSGFFGSASTSRIADESQTNGIAGEPSSLLLAGTSSRSSTVTTYQSKETTTIDEITISPTSTTSTTTTAVLHNSSPPHITLAPVSKLMGLSSQQAFQQHQQNIENHQTRHFISSECGDDRTTATPDDDDEDDDNDGIIDNQQQFHHHDHHIHQQSSSTNDPDLKDNSSDRDNNSPRPYDLGKINDDSNVSTTDRHSDDQGSDDFGSGLTNPLDFDTTRISVKNVENLLDKCSLGLFSPILQLAQMQSEDKQIHADSIRNLTKFSSYLECKNEQCQLENLREHYHCYDLPCFGKVLSKKEEIIRHLKWHKKRNESLNHGFLRFSSSDDCSATFGPNCTHNRKQTHYHCFQPNCDKVYISTSDVQMHSNYHRKDSAIFQEGFQRYRATEECNADYCMFSGQRTTHFHCRRDNCKFTFKNKADMEKHKSYHIKDLQLARDGFKKFLKTEACPYERCRFSRICNHIHCVRENCLYVLHSSGQLLSHKRKHERMDSEQAYRRFKMIQKAALFGQDLSQLGKNLETGGSSKPSTPSTSSSAAISPDLQIAAHGVLANAMLPTDLSSVFSTVKPCDSAASKPGTVSVPDLSLFYGGTSLPLEFLQQMQQRHQQLLQQAPVNFIEAINATNDNKSQQRSSPIQQQQQSDSTHPDNLLMSMMTGSNVNIESSSTASNNTAGASFVDIEHMIKQYFTDNCTRQINTLDLQQQNQPHHLHHHQTEPLNLNLKSFGCKQPEQANSNTSSTNNNCSSTDRIECFLSTNEPHMHCLIKDCEAVVPRALADITDHMRMHELNRNAENLMQGSNLLQITSIEGFFNRKRGRPPKNRVVEVYNNAQQSPQAIFTSFKLEKTLSEPSPTPTPGITQSSRTAPSTSQIVGPEDLKPSVGDERKFRAFQATEKCIDQSCIYAQQMHFHCIHDDNCKFATTHGRAMDIHLNKSHTVAGCVDSPSSHLEGFKYFDAGVDCRVHDCNSRRVKSHFHCTRCFQLLSQSDLQLHICICSPSDYRKTGKSLFSSSTPLPSASKSNSMFSTTSSSPSSSNAEIQSHMMQDDSGTFNLSNIQKGHDDSGGGGGGGGCGSAGGGGGSNEKTNDDTDLECNFAVKSESSEDDRVSVVRAAGTYFPENSDISDHSSTSMLTGQQQMTPAEAIPVCQRPFCKLKRKLHEHCELCNQAFSDKIKLKIHRLKHSSTRLGHLMDVDVSSQTVSLDKDTSNTAKLAPTDNSPNEHSDQPQDLSVVAPPQLSPAATTPTVPPSPSPLLPPNFVDNFSMQNLHLAQLALYQQNPFYYQNFYPFLGSHGLPISHPDFLKSQFEHSLTSGGKSTIKSDTPSAIPAPFPFVAAAAAAAVAASGSTTVPTAENFTNLRQKRKADDYSTVMELLPVKKVLKANKQGNFKIFKDEPVPHGYLKFRFNEDCNFPNCGYRNHQSHFHCRRNDCYYSFCDKTRFVQHTARHERLDKLMGDDFKQYRANMRCGYEDCAYNKNIGQNNKSSHFHCLKCSFICSDTNKVVAHRRQHSKMEFIRMAGFRKVANNEKCTATDHEASNGECTYSLKQTHYHCLICDCSVLSRAQLGSHRHRVQ